jgi:hypothetical protein
VGSSHRFVIFLDGVLPGHDEQLPGGVQHGAQLGPSDLGCLDELVIGALAISHANRPETALVPGRRSRDTVTDRAPGRVAALASSFSRTCRKRHLGDKRYEKATSFL